MDAWLHDSVWTCGNIAITDRGIPKRKAADVCNHWRHARHPVWTGCRGGNCALVASIDRTCHLSTDRGDTLLFYLVRIVKLDPVTGYFSAMPGGLIDMVLLGAERGGNERTIALMHSSRIFLVVFSLPPLLSLVTGIDTGTRAATYRPLDDLIAIDAAWFVLQ